MIPETNTPNQMKLYDKIYIISQKVFAEGKNMGAERIQRLLWLCLFRVCLHSQSLVSGEQYSLRLAEGMLEQNELLHDECKMN